jgi:ABC-type sugar transport system permease subunit
MVIWADTWKMTPLYAVIFLAALKAIPREIYESGRIDGANRWQQFWRITFPILRPVIGLVMLLRTVLIFQAFDAIYVLTSGGPGDSTRVIAFYVYLEAFKMLHFGRGAALSIVLFGLTIILAIVYSKVISFRAEEMNL